MSKYILLRKENDPLNSLIGQSFNQKSKLEAEKIINEIHYVNSKAQSRMIAKTALCYVVDNSEIKGVGGSTLLKDKKGEIFSNLILDQAGLWMAGLFKKQDSVNHCVILKDGSNLDRIIRTYATAGANPFNLLGIGDEGVQLQVGSGSTAPTRQDFNLETLFGTAPESGAFIPTTNPIWNSGLGNFKQNGAIIAGGAGTINESILTMIWRDTSVVIRGFDLFRDIISPAVSFISGQSIVLEYTIQL